MAVDYSVLQRTSNFGDAFGAGMQDRRQNQLLQIQQAEEQRAALANRDQQLYQQKLAEFLGPQTANTLMGPEADAMRSQQQNALMAMNPQQTMQVMQFQDAQRKAQIAQQQQQFATIVQHAQAVQQSGAPATYVKIRYPDIYQQALKDNPDAENWGDAEWRKAAADMEAEFSPQAGIDPYEGAFTVGETRYSKAGKPLATVTDELERKRLKIREDELAARQKKEEEENNITVNEKTAQMIADYKLPPLSAFAMSKPAGQALMARVSDLNPTYQGTEFPTRQKARKDFSTGQQGKSVNSFNVAIAHLDTLSQLSDALANNDIKGLNVIGNFFKDQFGKPAPTNFNAAKQIVADEVVKAIVGSGGALADREEAAKQISAANSPAQLKGVIETYQELMAGQLKGLKLQYEQNVGAADFERKLADETKSFLSRIEAKHKQAPPQDASVPAVGTIEGGHRFKGGNPADAANWEKV